LMGQDICKENEDDVVLTFSPPDKLVF